VYFQSNDGVVTPETAPDDDVHWFQSSGLRRKFFEEIPIKTRVAL
jgi:hypothetical protein